MYYKFEANFKLTFLDPHTLDELSEDRQEEIATVLRTATPDDDIYFDINILDKEVTDKNWNTVAKIKYELGDHGEEFPLENPNIL